MKSGPRRLSRGVQIVLAGELVSAVGSWSTVPYLFAFLHTDRGLTAGVVGGLLTIRAIGALLGAVAGGMWIDRLGVRRSTLLGLVATALTTLGLLVVHGPAAGALILGVYGFVGSALSAAMGALLGAVTSAHERQRAFAMRYVLGNLGGAGGAALAVAALSMWPSDGFVVLYTWDAASFGVLALAVVRGLGPAARDSGGAAHAVETVRQLLGYRDVLRHPAMVWVCAIAMLTVMAGYCQMQVGLVAFVAATGHSSAPLGWVFAANMVAVVIWQPITQRVTDSCRPTTSLAIGLLAMAAAWTTIACSAQVSVGTLVTAVVVLAAGELLLAPVLAALVNDLAPPGLQGRYNGAYTLTWTIGWLAGTALSGAFIGIGQPYWLFPTLISLLFVALAAVAVPLRRIQANA